MLASLLFPLKAMAACTQAVIGGHPDFPPYIWAEEGAVKGIGATATALLLDEMEIKVIHDTGYPYKRQLKMLARGQVDIAPLMARNPDREQYTLFIEPAYLYADTVIWQRSDSTRELNTLNDLNGLRGALRFGTTYGEQFDLFFRKEKILRVHEIEDAFSMLIANRVDYVVYDHLRTQLLIRQQGWEDRFRHSAEVLIRNPLYLAISRKSPCISLAPAFSEQLKKLIEAGRIREIVHQQIEGTGLKQ